MFYDIEIEKIIEQSLTEDIGTGDITTNSIVPRDQYIEGKFVAKQVGIVCGIAILHRVFGKIDKAIAVEDNIKDGEQVKEGQVIATIKGPAASILTGERVALNFLQRMSGIATKAYELTAVVKDTGAKITDTRKTTPGLRKLEKYAVSVGGAVNHRFNLSDGILIKDNHIKAAGGIKNAITAARENAPHTLKVEVEVEDMAQVDEALKAGADIIMLDNMDVDTMKIAVKKIKGRALIEASGNMGEKSLREVALTGVDFISVGALTHSVNALDINLKF